MDISANSVEEFVLLYAASTLSYKSEVLLNSNLDKYTLENSEVGSRHPIKRNPRRKPVIKSSTNE
ncbi:hypothetical protein G9P44_005585 [Scheffersomyces stipitis]|nr:hypothetical protein G9P44_005585 [Scheffersomyces stipitis]